MSNNYKLCLNSWPTNVPKTIRYPAVTLQEILKKTAREYPQNVAIICGGKEITYVQLDSLANAFAHGLVKLDVQKGDRVAIFLPNIPQFIIAYFGILKAGAVVTTISPLYREREVENQLRDSEARTIIALDSFLGVVDNVWINTKLKNVIVTSSDKAPKTMSNPSKARLHDFELLLKEAQPNSSGLLKISPRLDLAVLQYTGGTTGTPKGAMLTHANLVSNAIAFATWIKGTTSKETFLAALPLFHIYGMTTSMNVPISLAATMILMTRFEPPRILETIQKHKVTVFCGVPTMYSSLLSSPEIIKYDLTSIRVCISGASALSPQVQKIFMQVTGGFLAEGYGLTEASPVTHCYPVDCTMKTAKVGSVGLPLPNTKAKIVDLITGRKTLLPGETGELAVKGPQVMKGYWHKPDETAKVLCGGWLLTGDIAHMDSDGYFYITDRKKDLIKYKDYSVYPRELEDILYEHPAVKLCAIVGKPNPFTGEIPKAFIVLKEGTVVSAREIMAFANDKVATYKAIREVEFRKDLPISSAGKVLKRLLL